jgi:hypothetical protein
MEIDTNCLNINQFHFVFAIFFHFEMRKTHYRSSKSLLANVLDIDDDFRCNHRCNTLPHNPTYYRTVYRQGEDGSIGPIGGTPGGRLHETVSHTCLSSSAEYELALILKELRVITDTVRKLLFRLVLVMPSSRSVLYLLWLHFVHYLA